MEKIGDFYWAYADILRGIGINESMYDQRILAFMALKLLVDNELIKFNFDYKNNFGLDENLYEKYKGKNTKETFENLIKDIENLGTEKLKYFIQDKKYNPQNESENILHYINHKRTFPFLSYIEELSNKYLEMVLDIYMQKANFKNYPREKYKDLYEKTIARMKRLSGDLTGQHFTQKSIIHLMCEYALNDLKQNKKLAIYDPACGTGSMLLESYFYFKEHLKDINIEVFGQEMHGQTWLLAKIFLEISEVPNIIAYGNTLTNPAFDKINGNDSFDFIIANPPFGVDWKHDYDEVIKNMQKEENSNFLVVKDSRGKIITPKKSDGQFLFMLHILKLLENSKKIGKKAKAAVITSSTLISTGSKTSSESKIRKKIFQTGFLEAVIEQPRAMFTNTDITSHIWFFNTEHNDSKIVVLKADNDEKKLFTSHPNPQDKMKHCYNNKNIKEIIKFILSKKEKKYICKIVDLTDEYQINISALIDKKGTRKKIDLKSTAFNFKKHTKEFCEMSSKEIW